MLIIALNAGLIFILILKKEELREAGRGLVTCPGPSASECLGGLGIKLESL